MEVSSRLSQVVQDTQEIDKQYRQLQKYWCPSSEDPEGYQRMLIDELRDPGAIACSTFKGPEQRRFIDVLRYRGKDEPRGCFTGTLKQVKHRTREMKRLLVYTKSISLSSLKLERQQEYKETLESIWWGLNLGKIGGWVAGGIIGAGLGLGTCLFLSKESSEGAVVIANAGDSFWGWRNWMVATSAVAGACMGEKLVTSWCASNLAEAARDTRLTRALFKEMLVQEAFDSITFYDLNYLPSRELFTDCREFEKLICPITQECMLHAVKVPCCGQLMEEKAIRFWLHYKKQLKEDPVCPLCRGDVEVVKIEPQTVANRKFFNFLLKHIKQWETLRTFEQAKLGVGLPGVYALPSKDEMLELRKDTEKKIEKRIKLLIEQWREYAGGDFMERYEETLRAAFGQRWGELRVRPDAEGADNNSIDFKQNDNNEKWI